MNLPTGWFNEPNIETYKKFFCNIPVGGTAIELGTWKGRSICSVAEEIKARNIQVICVDTFQGTQTDEEKSYFEEAKQVDILQGFKNSLKEFGIENNVRIIAKTTDEGYKDVEDGIADLLFIDADHSYAAVKSDITNWKSKVKSGGTISGHDFGREVVKRAVRETLGEVNMDSDKSYIWFKSI